MNGWLREGSGPTRHEDEETMVGWFFQRFEQALAAPMVMRSASSIRQIFRSPMSGRYMICCSISRHLLNLDLRVCQFTDQAQ